MPNHFQFQKGAAFETEASTVRIRKDMQVFNVSIDLRDSHHVSCQNRRGLILPNHERKRPFQSVALAVETHRCRNGNQIVVRPGHPFDLSALLKFNTQLRFCELEAFRHIIRQLLSVCCVAEDQCDHVVIDSLCVGVKVRAAKVSWHLVTFSFFKLKHDIPPKIG